MKTLPQNLPKELTDKFRVVNNTLVRDVKENSKDRISLEIGDSKQPDFLPQAKISRWDNEVNTSVRFVDDEVGEPIIETLGKIVKYIKPKKQVYFYELDPSNLGEDGGLEIEVVLKEKPVSNILSFTIQTKGLNFLFQPPLTQQEIDEGESRPENVVGSYAVYHATKGGMNDAAGMEYKVGKAFHIYRPKVTDANGVEIWGELNIDEQNGLLTVTIDQIWLNNAVYPVIVDPTFGITSIGGSTDQFWSTYHIEGSWFTGSAGTLDSVTAYFASAVTTGNVDWKNCVYLKSDGSLVGEGTHYDPSSIGWWTSTFSSESISAVDYWITVYADNEAENFAYDTVSNKGVDYTVGVAPDSNTVSSIGASPTLQNRQISIYATYTASGGGAAATPAQGFLTTNTKFWGA